MNDTLLVTGGAGFIGSAVVRALIAAGRRVVNLDALTYAGNRSNLGDADAHPNHVFVEGSIDDLALLEKLFAEHRPRAAINIAAETHVDRSIDGPAAFVETNIVGAFALLEAARFYRDALEGKDRDGFRFVQVSTDEVYGSIEAGEFVEGDAYRPNSPYAAAKAAADHLARAYHRTYGLPVIVTNGSNTYGPCQFPEKLLPLMILNAIEGKPLPVYGDGGNVRDWLHVDDHAAGIIAALKKGAPGDSYNLGGGNTIPNVDVVRRLCAVLDAVRPRDDGRTYAEQIVFVKDRPGHDFRYALDCRRAAEKLGWRPATDFDDGLKATVAWYLERQDWCRTVTEELYDRRRLGLGRQEGSQR